VERRDGPFEGRWDPARNLNKPTIRESAVRRFQRFTNECPWREVVWALRRMEARGTIRGGRFVNGVAGEQYAAPRGDADDPGGTAPAQRDRPAAFTGHDAFAEGGTDSRGEQPPPSRHRTASTRGAATFACAGSFETKARRLAELNGVCCIVEYELDDNGNYHWTAYEWKHRSW
jgi:hypothetical protein